MKLKAMIFASAVMLVSAVTAIATLTARGGRQASDNPLVSRENTPKSTFSLARASAHSEWDVYSVGPSYRGLPLVAVLRREDVRGRSPYPANYISFVYGHCSASGDYGCAPPAEIQTWPACVRHRALYDAASPLTPQIEDTVVRGVPAAFLEAGRLLEVYTGNATVVLFARSKSDNLEMANLLRGVNVPAQASEQLPGPLPGAVDGNLSCG